MIVTINHRKDNYHLCFFNFVVHCTLFLSTGFVIDYIVRKIRKKLK